jgi:hypothetical protein
MVVMASKSGALINMSAFYRFLPMVSIFGRFCALAFIFLEF